LYFVFLSGTVKFISEATALSRPARKTAPTPGGFMAGLLRLASALAALSLLLSGVARADEKKKDDKKDDPHAALIGKPAPEITGDYSLNGKATKLADLKGKVVLVDFWAVWCGPCVATFPHLRDWNKEYKEKGLEIVGLTSYYERFGFDKKAGKLTRTDDREEVKKAREALKKAESDLDEAQNKTEAQKKVDEARKALDKALSEAKLTKDQEHEMLKDFAAHHKLEHRLMVLNMGDIGKIYKEYGVRGIPQVVLIDRKGNVRMIKVGSGEENAKALDEMIKTLIAEK
jgi:thiol-disulfide isomerase/thioredoxin